MLLLLLSPIVEDFSNGYFLKYFDPESLDDFDVVFDEFDDVFNEFDDEFDEFGDVDSLLS